MASKVGRDLPALNTFVEVTIPMLATKKKKKAEEKRKSAIAKKLRKWKEVRELRTNNIDREKVTLNS